MYIILVLGYRHYKYLASIIAIRLFDCSDRCDEEFLSTVGAATVGLWQDLVWVGPHSNTESLEEMCTLHVTVARFL